MGKKKDKKKGMDMEAKLVAANRMALAAFEAADALQRRALESGSGVEEATDALRCALEALGAVQAADSRPRDEELVRSAFKRAKAVLKRTEALKAAADAQPSEPLSVAEPASAAARVAESACVAARVAESAEAGPASAVEPASMAARAAEPAPEFAPTPVQAAAPIPAPMPAFEPEPAPASTPVQAAAPVPAARAPEFEPASTLGDVSRETSVRDVHTAPLPAPVSSGRAAMARRIALAAVEAAEAASQGGLPQAPATLDAARAALALADAAARAEAASTPDMEALAQVALASASRALADAQSLGGPVPAPRPAPVRNAQPVPAPRPEQTPAPVPRPAPEASAHAREHRAIDRCAVASAPVHAPASAPAPVHAAPAPAAPAPVRVAPAPRPEQDPALEDVSRETSVRDVRTAPGFVPAPAPGPSGMPAASPDEPLPAPGTLPLSAKERKRQARADARAAKERAAKERTSARKAPGAQAVCDHEAEEAQAKAARKAVVPRAEVGGKAAERPGAPTVPAPVASPAPAAAACAPEQKQPRAARNACIALLVLLLLVAGLVAAAWLGLFRLPAPVQDRIDLLPDPHAVSGRLNAADSPVAPGSYRLVVNQIPTSQGPANVVNVEFENPAQNEYSARMDVYLDDTGELVGSTRMVAPGSYLEDLALAADLAPGTYRATAKVGVYSGATQVNTMSAALELRIEGWD